MTPPSRAEIAAMIDHALLKPNLTIAELEAGCAHARAWGAAGACVLPWFVPRAVNILGGASTVVCTVIGFPLGGQAMIIKLAEADRAITDGASELDMVINQSAVLSDDWPSVHDEIAGITKLAHANECRVKIIFENCNLEDQHKIRLCETCTDLGVDWVKTSTGFGSGGATRADLELMSRHTRTPVEIKASGGVRDLETLLAMRSIDRVTRIGTSSTEAILSAL